MMKDERIERALQALPRAKPANDLSARIIAQLPHASVARNRRLMLLTCGVALLGVVLAYQTAFDLYANGAIELLSYYTAQPAIVTMYPQQAFDAMAHTIPWLLVLLSVCVLGAACLLVLRVTTNVRALLMRG